jgi:hypothetical protein
MLLKYSVQFVAVLTAYHTAQHSTALYHTLIHCLESPLLVQAPTVAMLRRSSTSSASSSASSSSSSSSSRRKTNTTTSCSALQPAVAVQPQ